VSWSNVKFDRKPFCTRSDALMASLSERWESFKIVYRELDAFEG
jgi:hypothetical protein